MLKLIGLECSGKRTLLHMLQNDRRLITKKDEQALPSSSESFDEIQSPVKAENSESEDKDKSVGEEEVKVEFGGECLKINSVTLNSEISILMLNKLIRKSDGIIMIMDSADQNAISANCEWVNYLLKQLSGTEIPLLLLANKIDKSQAYGEHELRQQFKISEFSEQKHIISDVKFEVFMSSVIKRHGYGEAIRWILSHILH